MIYGATRESEVLCGMFRSLLTLKTLNCVLVGVKTLSSQSSNVVAYFDFAALMMLVGLSWTHIPYSWVSRESVFCFLKLLSGANHDYGELKQNPTIQMKNLWYGRILVGIISFAVVHYGFAAFDLLVLDFPSLFQVSYYQANDLGYTANTFLISVLQGYIIIIEFYNAALLHLVDVHVTLCPFLMYTLMTDYWEHVVSMENIQQLSVGKIWHLYNYLKDVQNACWTYMGSFVVLNIICVLTYLPFHIVLIFDFRHTDFLSRVVMMFYFWEMYYMLKLYVDIYVVMNAILKRMLINEKLFLFPERRLRAMLFDIKTNQLGVKYGRFFTVSTGFAGCIGQTFLTFGLVNLMA